MQKSHFFWFALRGLFQTNIPNLIQNGRERGKFVLFSILTVARNNQLEVLLPGFRLELADIANSIENGRFLRLFDRRLPSIRPLAPTGAPNPIKSSFSPQLIIETST